MSESNVEIWVEQARVRLVRALEEGGEHEVRSLLNEFKGPQAHQDSPTVVLEDDKTPPVDPAPLRDDDKTETKSKKSKGK